MLQRTGVGESTVRSAAERRSYVTRLFLCHSSADKAFVRRLRRDVERSGVRCWLDETEMKVGDSIREKIEKGIQESDFLAIVLSAASVESPWLQKELDAAFIRQTRERGAFILPVVLEECQIPTLISGLKYADFRTDYGSGLEALLAALGSPPAEHPPRSTQVAGAIDTLMSDIAYRSNISERALRHFGEFVGALGLSQAERDVFRRTMSPVARRCMRDDDPEVRETAAYVAGVLRDQDCIPELEALLTDPATETHDYSDDEEHLYHVRVRALQSLCKIDEQRFGPLADEIVGSEDDQGEHSVRETLKPVSNGIRFGVR